VLDMAGIAGFMLAEASGALAVAAVLTSMYPVTTVVLAAVVLREPVTRHHAIGIVAAVAAIVLIGAGQA
jgi:drug/metabolite transporter (DMT)-like permease